jgi:hypothetical protein
MTDTSTPGQSDPWAWPKLGLIAEAGSSTATRSLKSKEDL